MTMRKDFLIQCRRRNIFPAHINSLCNNVFYLLDSDYPFRNKLNNITNSYKKQILNLEINITYHKIKTHTKSLDTYRKFIIEKSARVFYNVFFSYQETFKDRLEASGDKKYANKLKRLTLLLAHPITLNLRK